MDEIFPILGGAFLGLALSFLPPGARWWGAIPIVLLGTAATILSGEFRLSWEFLLVDIPLVGIACVAAMAVAGKMRRIRVER
jgi:hypothetical protein